MATQAADIFAELRQCHRPPVDEAREALRGTCLNDTILLAGERKRPRVSEALETRGTIPMIRYCLKRKEHREIQGTRPVTMKNGRPATRGRCGECGATMFRLGKES